jgi:HD-GYP domain-containing protein (c-di-GMP phosphodiesterase class II)
VKGAEYLVKTPGVPRLAVVNAYEHHMRFDLLGYPGVGKAWQQSLCSQMTAISDIFDALRTRRPYRKPLAVDEVLGTVSQMSGAQLHPQLVENFLRLMNRLHPEC